MPPKAPTRFRRLRAHGSGVAFAAATFLAFGVASSASAATIPVGYEAVSLTAAPTSVSVGDTVTITAVFTGLVDAYAYELDIAYDEDALAFVDDSEQSPSGGFHSATDTGSEVAIAATRLGTSPGLTGTQTLVTVRFAAIADGDAAVGIASGRIIGSDGNTTTIDPSAAGASTVVEIIADDEGTEPGSGGGGSPGGDPGSGSQPGTGSDTPADGSLAVTGADAAPWLIVGAGALALVAAGTVLALRRRTR
ncbi:MULTISPECIES: cohesin domain-containing protein [Microbacterium]|uniref:cohesin domain-containing protein n=1 Tax=Microbacterium TaxID=33882 RepID=UPI0021CA0F62|nr:cohesin domain-containing protein [Microbacterium sp. Mcb102]